MTTIEMRLAQRERPQGRPKMFHSWRSLSFLHWPVPTEALQRLLPPGLTVDTHEGSAYVGLVPFTMHGIRLSWLPAVPGTCNSHETNVRTYVVDERGVPGVWFFSLDAANWLMVQVARAWYRLPYVHAAMSVETHGPVTRYCSVRDAFHGESVRCLMTTEKSGEEFLAAPGSFEFFAVERYLLYAFSRGRLYAGRVFHEPYRLTRAKCAYLDETLLHAAGIARPDKAPVAVYSPGVDVEVFGIERC